MSNAEIVVVGAGVAGLSAALAVADAGQDVTLVTKADLVESNTYHAQGGIAAAVFADDDPKLHAADTMAAGHGLCEPRAVEILTREGADRVRQLPPRACISIVTRKATCCVDSKPRIRGPVSCTPGRRHRQGGRTGRVRHGAGNPLIHIIEHAFLEDLIVRDGAIAGVRLLVRGGETFRSADMAASRVILATGGAGRLYPYTTNPAVATADGLAAAWRAGAQVADVEFYQFHPTAMAVGEHFLVSEAVRGEGAVLLDEHGERYMTRVDERAELAPRDVVARENFRVMQAQGGKPVMLDVSPMRRENPDLAEFLRHRFPTIDAYTRSLGFDWSKEPIPVAPAAHYCMGGIRTDLEGRASIPGLYAAGECARTGVMGSNRLASNSLLEGLVYGRRAGLAAVNDPAGSVWNPVWFSNSATGLIVSDTPVELSMPAPDERAGANGRPAIWDRTRIQNTMWAGVGVLRDGDGLRQAIDQLGTGLALADADATEPAATACEPDPITRLENRNLFTVGYVEANAALRRTESRGAHAAPTIPSHATSGPNPSPTSTPSAVCSLVGWRRNGGIGTPIDSTTTPTLHGAPAKRG
ncbi:MAG: L-aspartate oxidase [Bifidobacterium bifidum]